MREEYFYIIVFLLLLLVFYLSILLMRHYRIRQRQLKRMRIGKKMEGKAKKVLRKKGFTQIEYQKAYEYRLKEDGSYKNIKIIPDFTAVLKGSACLIEVKWGHSAPSVRNEATRRQLLEYNFAIDPDRLFLLDMSEKKLKEIEF